MYCIGASIVEAQYRKNKKSDPRVDDLGKVKGLMMAAHALRPAFLALAALVVAFHIVRIFIVVAISGLVFRYAVQQGK